jgi:aminoglycoside phosphotransferase (APT) family kinase protein
MTGHADRLVSVSLHGNRRVVEKCYLTADSAEVFNSMVALWRSPFGRMRTVPAMPEPIALVDRTVVMAHVEGDPVGFRGDPGRSDELSEICAILLADFHNSGVAVARRRGADRLVRSLNRKAEAQRITGSCVYGAYRAAVDRLRELPRRPEHLVLSHGDFSPRNVLAAADGPVLIDFDRLQMASPARDLSYWAAWRWSTDLMGGGEPNWAAGDEFAGCYQRRVPTAVAAELEAGMAFHRAAGLLRIADGWSALRERPDLTLHIISEAVRQVSR